MISVKTTIDVRQATKQLRGLEQGIKDKIIARALNRIADQVKTRATREINREFNLTYGQVRQRIMMRKAFSKPGGLTAEVSVPLAKGRYRALHISDLKGTKDLLHRYDGVKRTRRRSKKGGVEFSILRGKRQRLADAFIGRGKSSGKLIVFQRRDLSDPRSRLDAKYVIDVPQMFNARRVKDSLIRLVDAKLPAEVERLLRVEMAR